MSDAFLADMRAKLVALRRHLESLASTSQQSSEVVELDQSRVGRLSRMDALQAQAMAQASGRRRAAETRDTSVTSGCPLSSCSIRRRASAFST